MLAIRSTCSRNVSFLPGGNRRKYSCQKRIFQGVSSSPVRINIWKWACPDNLHSKQLTKVVSGPVILISKKPWNTGEVFREFEYKIRIIIKKAQIQEHKSGSADASWRDVSSRQISGRSILFNSLDWRTGSVIYQIFFFPRILTGSLRPPSQKSIVVFLWIVCVNRKAEVVRKVVILTKQARKMDMDHSFFSRYDRLVLIEVNTMVQTTG